MKEKYKDQKALKAQRVEARQKLANSIESVIKWQRENDYAILQFNRNRRNKNGKRTTRRE